MSRDDDDPEGQNEAGEPWPFAAVADAVAELLVGLWQLEQANAQAEPDAEANETTTGSERSERL